MTNLTIAKEARSTWAAVTTAGRRSVVLKPGTGQLAKRSGSVG